MSSPGSMVATTTTLLTRSRTKTPTASATSSRVRGRDREGGGRVLRLGLGQDALLDSGGSTQADEDRPRTPTIAAAVPRSGQSSSKSGAVASGSSTPSRSVIAATGVTRSSGTSGSTRAK